MINTFRSIYFELVLFKESNYKLLIQLEAVKSFFSCAQQRISEGAIYSGILISSYFVTFRPSLWSHQQSRHWLKKNTSIIFLDKFFQWPNYVTWCFFRGQQIPAYVWPEMNVTWAQKPSLLIGADVASKQI